MAEYLLQNLNKFTLPTLILHGSNDRITDKKGSELFAEKSKIDDITFTEFADAEHLLLEDLCVLDVENRILDWLTKRLK